MPPEMDFLCLYGTAVSFLFYYFQSFASSLLYHFSFILASLPPWSLCDLCLFFLSVSTAVQTFNWFSPLSVTLLCEAKAQVDVKCPTLPIQDVPL